jgi:hypothetical protein
MCRAIKLGARTIEWEFILQVENSLSVKSGVVEVEALASPQWGLGVRVLPRPNHFGRDHHNGSNAVPNVEP